MKFFMALVVGVSFLQVVQAEAELGKVSCVLTKVESENILELASTATCLVVTKSLSGQTGESLIREQAELQLIDDFIKACASDRVVFDSKSYKSELGTIGFRDNENKTFTWFASVNASANCTNDI